MGRTKTLRSIDAKIEKKKKKIQRRSKNYSGEY